jgi:hypothetical protein
VPLKAALDLYSQEDVRKGSNLDLSLRLADHEPVICQRGFRIIQGKRIVCSGLWGRTPVVVKLYFDPGKALRHQQKSLSGAMAFLDNTLPAPQVLYSGKIPQEPVYIILFEYLADSLRLDTALARATDTQARLELKKRLIACVSAHHRQGIVQADPHPGNFLVQNTTLFSLDGDQVRSFPGPVPLRRSLKSLAGFLAFFPPAEDQEIPLHVNHYCRLRHVPCSKALPGTVAKWTKRLRHKRLKQYLRKIYRNRDPFVLEKSRKRVCVYDRRLWRRELQPIQDNPDSFFPPAESTVKAQQVVLSTAAGAVLLQKNKAAPFFLFRKKGDLAREWENAHRQSRLGEQAHRPIMLLSEKTGVFGLCRYLVSECPASESRPSGPVL